MLALAGIASISLAGAATALPYTIYSTGFVNGSNSVEQSNEGVDGNYTITEEAGTTLITPASAYVTNVNGFPFPPTGPWLPDSSTSQWISPLKSYAGLQASGPGVYDYETWLTLTGLGGGNYYVIQGLWATDNNFDGIYVNGNLIPGTIGPPVNEYTSFTAFTDSSYLTNGVNTLEFKVLNGPGEYANPTGVNVQLAGYYYTTPEPSTVMPIVVGVMGLGLLMVRKKRPLEN